MKQFSFQLVKLLVSSWHTNKNASKNMQKKIYCLKKVNKHMDGHDRYANCSKTDIKLGQIWNKIRWVHEKDLSTYFLKDRIRLSGRISSPLLYYSITMAKTDRPSFFWWYSKSYCIWGICNTRPYTSVFGTISPNLSEGERKYFDHRMLINYKDQYVIMP